MAGFGCSPRRKHLKIGSFRRRPETALGSVDLRLIPYALLSLFSISCKTGYCSLWNREDVLATFLTTVACQTAGRPVNRRFHHGRPPASTAGGRAPRTKRIR